jgi:hypothetical protein
VRPGIARTGKEGPFDCFIKHGLVRVVASHARFGESHSSLKSKSSKRGISSHGFMPAGMNLMMPTTDADDNTLERYRVRVPFSRSLSKAPFGSAPRGPTC